MFCPLLNEYSKILLKAHMLDASIMVLCRPCLPNVYQKRRGTLVFQGLRVFPFSGCLPNVYQDNFFTIKLAIFTRFRSEILIFFAMQGALYFSAEKSGALPPVFARFFAEMHKSDFGENAGAKSKPPSFILLRAGRSIVFLPQEKE